MSLTQRRLKSGLRWRTERPPRISLRQTIKDAAIIIAVLLFILLVHAWTVEQDLQDKLSQERKKTMLANARTASLMNGRGVYDKVENVLYMADKVIAVPLGEMK